MMLLLETMKQMVAKLNTSGKDPKVNCIVQFITDKSKFSLMFVEKQSKNRPGSQGSSVSWAGGVAGNADVTVTAEEDVFSSLMRSSLGGEEAINQESLQIEGDLGKFRKICAFILESQ